MFTTFHVAAATKKMQALSQQTAKRRHVSDVALAKAEAAALQVEIIRVHLWPFAVKTLS